MLAKIDIFISYQSLIHLTSPLGVGSVPHWMSRQLHYEHSCSVNIPVSICPPIVVWLLAI